MIEERKIRVLYVITSCKKTGPIQQMLNLIRNLDRGLFEPFLITIYPENESLSMLRDYLPLVQHQLVPLSKVSAILGPCSELKNTIEVINPDVIHSFGVFPDYVIERFGKWKHTFTCRNYVYDDYPDEYGVVMGNALARIHLKAIHKCHYVCCCSESLHNIYKERLHIDIPFIRNGVDISHFTVPSYDEKKALRLRYGIPEKKTVWIYGGVYNGRKNQAFLLNSVIDCCHFKESVLILPGDGEQYNELKNQYGHLQNIIMPGNVLNMNEFLAASDLYVSTSKSEGMPNGVLEAMATGLPVLLSDIDQHMEILKATDRPFGFAYRKDNRESFIKEFDRLFEEHTDEMSMIAESTVRRVFSAETMSRNYQMLYREMCGR